MPRRKKLPEIPDYTGVPNNEEKLIVQKSNPLQSLSETGMTLPEFKILDAYLSRIDSHNPDERYVRFEKGELENLLGVTQIKKEDLSKRIDNLFQVITIKDRHKKNGFVKIALFEKAEAFQDENGLWQVNLACSSSAMEYVFNIDNIGYLRYRLKNVVDLTSRYSYILYLYLENNRFRKSWTIPLSDLKNLLNCTGKSYEQFKVFNDRVLKLCYKELREKTSLKFEYEPTDRRGRKYTAIKFTVSTVTDVLPEPPEQLPLPLDEELDEEQEQEVDYGSELANLLGDAACKNEFTIEQIRILQDLVIQACGGSDKLEMCNYLIRQVHKLDYYNSRKKIPNRFEYLRKMIKNDIT